MVGSIDASCAGQTAVIDFQGDRVLLRFPNYRTAGNFQQLNLPNPTLLIRALRSVEQRVFAKIGVRKEFEIFPNPSWILRLLSPQLRRLVKT